MIIKTETTVIYDLKTEAEYFLNSVEDLKKNGYKIKYDTVCAVCTKTESKYGYWKGRKDEAETTN